MISSESNYSNTVEVNGVSFQTEIQSVILVPLLPWTKNPVKLGIHVTNNTLNYLYFERLDSLVPLPTLIDSNGNLIEIDCDMLRLRVKGKPYYSVASRESKFFSFETFLSRRFFKLQLKIYNEAGGFFYFRNLNYGKHQLQISYKKTGLLPILLPEERASARAWAGEVTIPFVDFCIG
ncbi:MAG: hypothetical protein V7L04_18470 [Nostoc sp.]|uniref:hypothetical protein n=1 Tax=Nostoc sp. TaxID=1180 RepID=UPI002FFB9984